MDREQLTLDFDKIIVLLKEQAVSDPARAELSNLAPDVNEARCRGALTRTTAARQLLDVCGTPPLPLMAGLTDTLDSCLRGELPTPLALTGVARFAAAMARMQAYLRRGGTASPILAAYGPCLAPLDGLREMIEAAVTEDVLRDDATPLLRTLRRRCEAQEAGIRDKLEEVRRRRKEYLADDYVTKRQGRWVLPVQKRCQSLFGGTVVETSGKGGTVFMEPTSVAKLQGELDALRAEMEGEERRICYALGAAVAKEEDALRRDMGLMTELDVLFAKAKLSAQMEAREPMLTAGREIALRGARHPLLPKEHCVPLDLTCAADGIVITGPNTGGKTVALKAVGLLSMMAQSGLHIPCEAGSSLPLRDGWFCDAGDSQSIAQDLSTFSGHLCHVIDILRRASRDSLVLLDELGSGTDPMEGMGVAIAVMEELRRRGSFFLVTTHDPQVKTWAVETAGVLCARMAFDRETLRPLYVLELGKTGESCALDIAARLGLPPQLIDRARSAAYGTPSTEQKALPVPRSRLERTPLQKPESDAGSRFQMGDSVQLLPEKEAAIVYRPADDKGDVVVQVKGEKRLVKHTRLHLVVPAAELYPADYDFSIIFDTVENRKARHQMARKFDPKAQVEVEAAPSKAR